MQPPIEIATAIIQLDDQGILRIKIKEGAKVDLKEVKLSFDAYRKLGCNENNKVLKLLQGDSYTFDDDALKYSSKYGKDFFIASALVNKSTAITLVYNFFKLFLKQPVPFKMFSSEEKALQWLKAFRK